MAEKFTSVDEYIASFPEEVQEVLTKVRQTIHDAVPGSGERISYQIPAVTLDGKPLMYFSGWRKHISIHPIPETDDEATRAEIERHTSGKGTLRFKFAEPIPYELIGRLAGCFLEQRLNRT